MEKFITTQLKYCAIIWMVDSKSLSDKTNEIQERALRVIYNHFCSNCDNSLPKDKSMNIIDK